MAAMNAWHAEAAALIEESAQLESILGDGMGHDIWMSLGGLTQADGARRTRAARDLADLIDTQETRPAWPTIARCLVRIASANVPGRYLAALVLYDLVTRARAVGLHHHLLDEPCERALDTWTDEALRPFAAAVRRHLHAETGPLSRIELMSYDEYLDIAEHAEGGLQGRTLDELLEALRRHIPD